MKLDICFQLNVALLSIRSKARSTTSFWTGARKPPSSSRLSSQPLKLFVSYKDRRSSQGVWPTVDRQSPFKQQPDLRQLKTLLYCPSWKSTCIVSYTTIISIGYFKNVAIGLLLQLIVFFFQDVVSSCEFINCQSVQMQVNILSQLLSQETTTYWVLHYLIFKLCSLFSELFTSVHADILTQSSQLPMHSTHIWYLQRIWLTSQL